jgi:hypothetical protein
MGFLFPFEKVDDPGQDIDFVVIVQSFYFVDDLVYVYSSFHNKR